MRAISPSGARRPVRARTALLIAMALALWLLPVPGPASATVIHTFDHVDGIVDIAYIDFVVVNASSTPMRLKEHGVDWPSRQWQGNEPQDNSVLAPGDYMNYAAKYFNASGRRETVRAFTGVVQTTWSLPEPGLQVRLKSGPDAAKQKELIECSWYRNNDFSRELSDVPFTCTAAVDQGMYGHTTEYLVIADKDPKALDDAHRATTLRMIDKLCGNTNAVKAYRAKCEFDPTGRATAKETIGLDTVVTRAQNCLTDRDFTMSNTTGTTIANTIGWTETTTVGSSFKWMWPNAYELTVSFQQSFAYSSSTTATSTDSSTYTAALSPRTAGEIEVSYPVLQLSTSMSARIGDTTLLVDPMVVTLREPDSQGSKIVKNVPFDPAACAAARR